MKLTHIDLFSGIGGFALAARWAGIETVQFVEIDKFCQKVLQKNFPGVPIHDDIKSFTNANWDRLQKQRAEQQASWNRQLFQNKPFLITGGFPCQPFSCAGKRRGKEDDRYLWEEMLRVIKEFKPTWIIGENVNGIRSMEFQDGLSDLEGDTIVQEDGEDGYTNVLDGICNSLEALNYEVQPIIVPACAVNAPHRRDRVWIVAHAESKRSGGEPEKVCREKCRQVDELLSNTINTDCHVADTQKPERKQSSRTRTGREGFTDGNEFTADAKSEQTHSTEPRGLHAESCGKDSDVPNAFSTGLQGSEPRQPLRCPRQSDRSRRDKESSWDENWLEVATRLCRVDDGLPRKLDRVNRLKALGNAVVPQIPFLIMTGILDLYT